jgi:hypothetical protein
LDAATPAVKVHAGGCSDDDREEHRKLRYKAGYRYVDGGVHAQVLDFPAAITCAGELDEARWMLGIALVDVAEAALESGQALPIPNPEVFDPEMDIEEPIHLHLRASAGVREVPTGAVPRSGGT